MRRNIVAVISKSKSIYIFLISATYRVILSLSYSTSFNRIESNCSFFYFYFNVQFPKAENNFAFIKPFTTAIAICSWKFSINSRRK